MADPIEWEQRASNGIVVKLNNVRFDHSEADRPSHEVPGAVLHYIPEGGCIYATIAGHDP